jgi:SAM-dependent methyltransferase
MKTQAAATTPWTESRLFTLQDRKPRVLFGRMYEDPDIELATFPPPPARVLCVASAGDTAAALAAAGYEVTAVDINPAQLDYARARLVRGEPPVEGSAERLLALGRAAAGALLPAWRPAALTAFLHLDDPAEQIRRWRTELDGAGLRLLLGASLRPFGAVAVGVSPAFRGALPGRFDEVMRTRLARGFARHPNADNPWARRLLLGRTPDRTPESDDPAAPQQTPTPTPTQVRLLVADIADHLERSPAGFYDAVTLSNVLDGPGPAFARRLRDAVRHGVRPGGVAVLRRIGEPGAAGPGLAAQDRSLLWGAVRIIRL